MERIIVKENNIWILDSEIGLFNFEYSFYNSVIHIA